MIAAKFGDLVLGLDIHAVTLPPPAPPAPTPLPHPFFGVVFDPVGAAVGAAMGAVFGGGGVVLVNGLPNGNTGTEVKGNPHIPTPPGIAPHPSDAPTGNEGTLITGSKTVEFGGSSQSRLGSIVMSCNYPINLPTSVCLAVPMGAPVLIGGPEAVDFAAAATQAIRTKWVSSKLHALTGATKGSWRSKVICFLTGHPVDVMTGELIAEAVDFELPGTIPLVWERNYRSRQTHVDSLGPGWTHPLADFVEESDAGLLLRLADGRPKEHPPLALDAEDWDGEDRYSLVRTRRGYELRTWDGQRRCYERVSEDPKDKRFALVAVRDPAQNAILLRYEAGLLRGVRDSADRELDVRWTKSAAGPRIEGVYFDGEPLVQYRYDKAGMLAAAVDPLGHALTYTYEGGVMVEERHKGGLTFRFQWTEAHPEGWCVRTWGENPDAPPPPRGSKRMKDEARAAAKAHIGVPRFVFDRRITYDPARFFTSVEDGRGGITQYWGNALGLVERMMDPAGNTTTYTWDRLCRKVAEKDPLGHERRWEYDALGNTVREADPLGHVITRAFGANGTLVRLVDGAGGEWRVDWDPRRKPLWVWAPDGSATRNEHDERGRLVRHEDPNGHVSRLTWTEAHTPSTVTDGEGHTTILEHDRRGRVTRVLDAGGRETRAIRDVMGRVTHLQRADGERLSLRYDPEGNLVERVDGLGRKVELRFSGMGKLVEHRDPLGHRVRLGYDADEALLLVENQAEERYTFELDKVGRVKRERAFDGTEHRTVYDAAGRPSTVLGPANRAVKLEHDALGRLVKRTLRDDEEAYAYDPRGLLVEARTKATTVRFERDALGRIVREQHGDGTEIGSRFDPGGRRIERETSLWHHTTYGWDKAGELKSLSHGFGPKSEAPGLRGLGIPAFAQEPWEMTIVRDPLGLELARRMPGGVVALWKRDRFGRPEQREVLGGAFPGKEARSLSRVGYRWRGADELAMLVDTREGPTQYEHDARGHLIRALFADGSEQHRVSDAVSNLYATADRSDRAYGRGGRLERVGNTELRYDHEGRLAEKVLADGAKWVYRWTESGRLAAVVRPDGGEVRFLYDALGRRVRKEYGDTVTEYVWDGDDLVHERVIRAGEAQPVVTWLFEPGTFAPAAKLVGRKRYAVITDHLGTPTALVTETGKLAWKAQLDVWGVPRAATEGVEARERTENPWRYPGQYEDAETGLYYNRFRYYDPEAGRYVSPDPIGLAGGLAAFGYVFDPLGLVDPLGLHEGIPRDLWDKPTAELLSKVDDYMFRQRTSAKDGTKGLVHRIREQITGKMRPGSNGWATHEAEILAQQKNLREHLQELAKRGEPPPAGAWKLATRDPPTGNEASAPRGCK